VSVFLVADEAIKPDIPNPSDPIPRSQNGSRAILDSSVNNPSTETMPIPEWKQREP
jgi:hypothetical protein